MLELDSVSGTDSGMIFSYSRHPNLLMVNRRLTKVNVSALNAGMRGGLQYTL